MHDRLTPPNSFIDHFALVTSAIGKPGFPVDLEDRLNQEFPATGSWFEAAFALCRQGVAEGWLCWREADGIKFGRVVKPCEALNGMSIDVVDMDDVVGPNHVHTNGEIDLVMPIDKTAQFDGCGAGWKVYPAGSAHRPKVSGGRALVLYLLPEGAIEFTAE
jgi:hypothetical protein